LQVADECPFLAFGLVATLPHAIDSVRLVGEGDQVTFEDVIHHGF
jgi:hypothetical protein